MKTEKELKDDIWKVVESWVVIPSPKMIDDIFNLVEEQVNLAYTHGLLKIAQNDDE